MKHNIESYKETLIAIFGNKKKILREELLVKIAESRKVGNLDAGKILNYCRTKGIVKSEHYYSTYFKYSLNINL